MKKLAILGKFNPAFETHAATNTAIEHSKKVLEIDLGVSWISTDDISEDLLKHFHGFLVAPGSPYKNMEKVLFAIEYTGHPFFIGTLFVPQTSSTEKNPHPIVTGFLQVIMKIDIAEQTSAGDAQS